MSKSLITGLVLLLSNPLSGADWSDWGGENANFKVDGQGVLADENISLATL